MNQNIKDWKLTVGLEVHIQLSTKSKRHVILKKNQKKSAFKKYMLNFLKSEKNMDIKKKFFLAIHYAYAKINKINLDNIKVIVAHEHVPWNCEKYEKYFTPRVIYY